MNSEDASPLQIVIAGMAGSGKTTFTQRFRNLDVDVLTQPTMGIDVHIESQFGLKFFLYDLGGQDTFLDTIWPITLPKANAVIYLLDSAFNQSIKAIQKNFMSVLRFMNDVPILILANKQDLPFSKTIEELEEKIGFKNMLSRENITNSKMYGISALRGDGVNKAIDWLVHQVFRLMNLKIPQIHEVYVYNRDNGLPLAYLHPEVEDEIIVNREADQATLVSAFYSALNNFSNDIMQSNVQALTLRQSSSSNSDNKQKELLLLNYNDEVTSLSCLIIADAHEEITQLEKMARFILKDLKTNSQIDKQLTGTLLDLRTLVLDALKKIHPETEDTSMFLAKEQTWLNSFGITENEGALPEKDSLNETDQQNESARNDNRFQNEVFSGEDGNFTANTIELPNKRTDDETDEYLEAFRKLTVLEKAAELKRRRQRRREH